jgi:uncharacterized Zn-finger protein
VTELKAANTEKNYKISQADLPLSCPTSHMRVWDAHPRVYLSIEETGVATCPYCGACFELVDLNES